MHQLKTAFNSSLVRKMSRPHYFILGALFGFAVTCVYFLGSPAIRIRFPALHGTALFQGHESGMCPDLKNVTVSLETLNITIKQLLANKDPTCLALYHTFHRLYSISHDVANLELSPPGFKARMRNWLGNSDELMKAAKEQEIIFLRNLWTDEEIIYNRVRGLRPSALKAGKDKTSFLDELSESTRSNCDFCNYTHMMNQEQWARIQHPLVFTTTNAFKFDALHGMVAIKTHHPTIWSWEQMEAMFTVGLQWYQKARHFRPDHFYPTVWWDLLPIAGSSLVHPHIHLTLNQYGYYGEQNRWVRAMERYNAIHGVNYFDDLFFIYTNLGLTYRLGQASAIASMTPRKDGEVIILCPALSQDCIRLIYLVLRVFLDKQGGTSFTFAMLLPPLGEKAADHPSLPVIIRTCPRGSGIPYKTDISGLELFGATNVNKDPLSTGRTLLRHLSELRTRAKRGTR